MKPSTWYAVLSSVALWVGLFVGLPMVTSGQTTLPVFAPAELSLTAITLGKAHNAISDKSATDPQGQCAAYTDAHTILVTHEILRQRFGVGLEMPDLSGQIAGWNQILTTACAETSGGSKEGQDLGKVVVVSVPPSELGGGGTVQLRASEIVLAYLLMTEAQRTELDQYLSLETGYALRSWIADNYSVAQDLTASLEVASDLPLSYATPPDPADLPGIAAPTLPEGLMLPQAPYLDGQWWEIPLYDDPWMYLMPPAAGTPPNARLIIGTVDGLPTMSEPVQP